MMDDRKDRIKELERDFEEHREERIAETKRKREFRENSKLHHGITYCLKDDSMLFQMVYLMQADNGLIKIGVTNDIERRIKQCEQKYHTNIYYVMHTPLCNHAKYIEEEVHDILFDKWKYLEWFNVDMDYAKEILGRTYLYHSLYVEGFSQKDVYDKWDIICTCEGSEEDIKSTHQIAADNHRIHERSMHQSVREWKEKNGLIRKRKR